MPRCQKLFLLKWKLCLVVLLLFFTTHYYSQPYTHTYAPLGDAYITKDIPDENYGTDDQLYVVNVDGMTSLEYCSLLKFDVSNIPSNAIITEVELKLKSTLGNQSELIFQYLTENWGESTVTWDTRPTESNQFYFEEIPTTSFLAGPNITYHHFDDIELKNMIQYWVYDASLNFGVILKKEVSTTINTNTYSSKEAGVTYWGNYPNGQYTTVDHRPKLTVQYVLPIEIDLVSVTHASTTSSGDGSITATASGGNGTYTYQWYNSSGSVIGTNSPTISGLNYGWYGVKVTDGLGVESYMSFIVGVECEKVSISYNPGADYVDDAYISNLRQTLNLYPSPVYSDYIDHNYGGASPLTISRGQPSVTQYGEVHNSYNTKTLLRFNLILDPVLKINKSDLQLQVASNSGSGNTPFLKLTTEQWQENVVTYNNQPTHSSTIQKSTNITSTGLKTIDTKAFWEYWQGNPNYGYFIDLQYPNSSGSRSVTISSSDHGTPAQRPQIEFELSILCQYVELFSTLTGGYYQLLGDKLHVAYDEQYYTGGDNLEFSVYNTSRVEQAVPSVVTEYGDNRITFDMSGLSTGVYTLEVKGKKNRTYYLRFKKN